MALRRLKLVAFCLWAVFVAICSSIVQAAKYPDKPIRLIVMFTPGGPTDVLARGLARSLSESWKQPVIVENRPGAGGILTSTAVLEATRDGYTLGVYSDGFSIAPAIYAKLPYNPEKDFIPLAELASAANVVVVAPNSPYQTLGQIVVAGKISQKVSYASAGIGSAMHMQGAVFAQLAHMVDPIHIPFRGTPESLNEVIAGRVDYEFAPLSNAIPLIKAGKLKALAVSTASRSPFLPNVPTVEEAGIPGFAAQQWWGVFAPAGVPEDVVAKLEVGIHAALQTDRMKELIKQLSSSPSDVYGRDFRLFVDSQIQQNRIAAKTANISTR